ncbi:membrane integrity-associated transporter subunit PqiC [Azospirillum sp. TSH100]|uniref:PqiC family protein n=1 Tax=Azospirillum sp. TSH100 TaxID=652764 RepID=UPI000D65B35C|nr:PqiC family protein [Azospirillum sp. TSH100]QCG89217.1 membrane integrity-associated transporter subunit PqiC [Azospirillum sp. TSH100]
MTAGYFPGATGRRVLLGWLLAVSLAGCTSARLDWFRPVPLAGPVRADVMARVELRDVTVARALDRPDILRLAGDTRLVPTGGQWAAAPGDLIAAVLRRNLADRLPAATVTDAVSGIATGAIDGVGAPAVLVEVRIDRFEADADGRAVLTAHFVLRHPHSPRPPAERSVEETVSPAGPGPDALVLALSRALARLADRIADALTAS